MNGEQSSFEEDYASRFHRVDYSLDSTNHISPAPKSLHQDEHQAERTAEYLGRLRQELKENVHSDTYGIDVDGIDRFFSTLQLPRRDYILAWPGIIRQEYNPIVERYGWAPFPEPTETSRYFGAYPAGLEIAIVERILPLEEQYGNVFTDAVLVHELAHGTSSWNEWGAVHQPPQGPALTAKRVGQSLVMPDHQHQSFIEEGFAAKVTQDYLRQRDEHFAPEDVFYSDIAGNALREFCNYDSRVFPAYLRARSEVEGLRDVAKLYEELMPGLYTDLGHLPYTEEGFTHGKQMVTSAIAQKRAA